MLASSGSFRGPEMAPCPESSRIGWSACLTEAAQGVTKVSGYGSAVAVRLHLRLARLRKGASDQPGGFWHPSEIENERRMQAMLLTDL